MFIIEIQGEGFFRFSREHKGHIFSAASLFPLSFFSSPSVISLLSCVKRSDHFFLEKMEEEEEEEEEEEQGSYG